MKARFSGLLFGLFLLVGVVQGAAAREWGGMKGPRTGAPALERPPAAAPVSPIIADPLGDHITTPGTPIVDIGTVEGGSDGVDVTLVVHFSPDTVMSQVVGFIDLDADQNPGTGVAPNANFFIPGAMQDIGVDFFLALFNLPFSGLVDVYETVVGNFLGSVPATIVGQSLEITVPLSMLGGDDGAMDVGMVLGNSQEPTDAAPDVGHGTIGAVGQATISPGSSTLVTTQFFDVVFIINTFGAPITGVTVSLDGIDVTAAVVGFPPVIGSTPAGQLTARLPGIGAGMLGPGFHDLSISVTTPAGTFGNMVGYEVIPNTEP